MSETALETLQRERNLYKGKYRALLKLVSRTRNKLVQVTDHIEDEGDRRYFGSTNDADDLKELYHEMMDWIWDAVDETNRMKSDPYADVRKQRARAKKAEAESVVLRKALTETRECLDGEPTYHHEGMGCGLEDRNIRDRYQAMQHGWDSAMERTYAEHVTPAIEVIDAVLQTEGK